MSNVRWIKSTSWELPFFGLPREIPWPADVDPAIANQSPFEVEHLLNAIEQLGPEAQNPWKSFLEASEHHEKLAEALEGADHEEALEALDAIEEIHPGTAFALYHRAHIARADGGDLEAIELYKEAAEKAPMVGPIWGNLGSLYALREEVEPAKAAFRKALAINPQDRVALEGLTALRELVKLRSTNPKRPDDCRFVEVATFRQMAQQQINALTDPEQLLTYADQLLRDGNAPEAGIRAAERATELAPGDGRIMLTLAAAYRVTGEVEKMKATLERFVAMFPDEPIGHLQLAQAQNALKNEAAEFAALDRVLELDPNAQQALLAKFRLAPGEHDPAVEDKLAAYSQEHNSWMAALLASAVARERGDHRAVFRHTKRAMEMAPDNEEVLVNHASAIGDMKEIGLLTQLIKPAVESGKYSKRLDWAYAHVLRQLHLTSDAVAVIRQAAKEAPDDFQKMADLTVDSWIGLLTGCGVRLEVHKAGFLPRPIVIALPDGDGAVLIEAGVPLPAEAKFPWRASGDRAAVALQQGESTLGNEPLELGVFLARDLKLPPAGSETIQCHIVANRDGALHFRATQDGHKLHVGWTNYPGS
jgi:tetratricopeptide (TPR) repeat protein